MIPGSNHARAIRARLAHLDRNLTIIERIAREGERGVLHETTALSVERAREVSAAVDLARRRIESLSRGLGMDRDVVPGEQVIGGLCGLLCETVVDTRASKLGGYGPVPDELRVMLDPAVSELELILEQIRAAALRGTADE